MMVTLFNGEGYQLRGGIRLGRTNKFRASEIGYEIRSSDPANILQLRGRFTGLSVSRIGVDWDTGLTLSAGDPLVNEIAIAGVANGFVSSGPKDDEIIRKFIEDNRPWSIKFSFTLGTNVISRTVPFNLPTPEIQTFWEKGGPRWFVHGSPIGSYTVRYSTNSTLPWGQWKDFDFGRKITPNFLFPFPPGDPVFLRALMIEP
jgi:hypothetical protein